MRTLKTDSIGGLLFPAPGLGYNPGLRDWLEAVLAEDVGRGDVTSNSIVPPEVRARAVLLAKQDGVVAGLPVVRLVYDVLGVTLTAVAGVEEGSVVEAGDVIGQFEGPALGLLTGERVALNILQRMCGVATATSHLVSLLQGTKCRLADTRKTMPGMRLLDKYAVRVGGGINHRLGLDDAVLIKDNHIALAGGVRQAVAKARNMAAFPVRIEVEASTPEHVDQALAAGVDIIMLDNMAPSLMAEMVRLIDGRAIVEASGNIDERNIAEVAAAGVDYISVGAITHSAKALDISMKMSLL